MSVQIDYSDPAAVLAVLRPAYIDLLRGKSASEIDIPQPDGGTIRTVYHTADIEKLKGEIGRLEAMVASKKSSRPIRRCLIGG